MRRRRGNSAALTDAAAPHRERQTRKSHRKSRNGCLSCKRRKIKCDEQGPPCAACIIRGFECSIVPASTPNPSASTSSPVTEAAVSAPAHEPASLAARAIGDVDQGSPVHPVTGNNGPQATEPSESNIQELELLHYYTAHTYKSMSVVGLTDATWQIFVPQQALQHQFLLHGVLGLAALHICHDVPEKREIYLPLSQHYQERAFSAFRSVLDHIGPDNCHAMMAFSVIAMVYAMATPNTLPENEVVERMLVLLSFLQCIGTISSAGWEWLLTGPFGIFLDIDTRIELDDPKEEDQRLFERLRQINNSSLRLVDPSGHQTIEATTQLLERTYRSGELLVLGFLPICDPSYIAMLRREHRVALLVFVHWAIPLHRLRRLWWVGDMANLLVAQIAPVLEELGEEWTTAIDAVRSRISTP